MSRSPNHRCARLGVALVVAWLGAACGDRSVPSIGRPSTRAPSNPVEDPGSSSSSPPYSLPSFRVECKPGEEPAPATGARRLTGRQVAWSLQDVLPWIEAGSVFVPSEFFLGERPTVYGFENDAAKLSVSRTMVEDASSLARTVGRLAAEQVARVPGCRADRACLRAHALRVARRLWRHDLGGEETALLGALFDEAADRSGPAVAYGATLEAVVGAPDFLYLLEPAGGDEDGDGRVALPPYALAARLAYMLWSSAPDDALLDAAAQGRLATREDLAREVRRMTADARFVRTLGAFHQQWLAARVRTSVQRTPPPGVVLMDDALDAEFEHFFGLAWEGGLTLDELLSTTTYSVNDALAIMYGAAPAGGQGWRTLEADPARRKGVLTLLSYLAARTDNFDSSPIKRGHTPILALFCADVPPPPANLFASLPKPGEMEGTNRDRYEFAVHRQPCWSCHAAMNQLGYGFENYDLLGMWRSQDDGHPVDASGHVVGTDVEGPFVGALEFIDKVRGSAQVRDCYASHWMRYALGRHDTGCDTLEAAEAFARSGGNVGALVEAVVSSTAFRTRSAVEAAP
jgi:hypothetical protein